MDESKLRALVTEHVGPMMERLGIPHWTIDFTYDLRETNGRYSRRAVCNRQVNYNRAHIELDPSEFDGGEPEKNLRTLRHELFHVLLSPFDLFYNAAEELWKDDPVKQGVLDTIWNYACEQGVINLERMHHGLTRRECPMAKKKANADVVPMPKSKKSGPKAAKTAAKKKGKKKGTY